MSTMVLGWALAASQLMIAVAMGIAAWRMTRGPRAQDRILGLDTLYLCAMLMIVLIGVRTGQEIYYEAALVIGLLGFVATVALAKFLMRGEVIE